MRLETTIELDKNRVVRLRELRIKDVRQFLVSIPKDLEKMAAFDLLTTQIPRLLGLLENECIFMPDGETIENLSFSEVTMVASGFKELHPDFFGHLRTVMGTVMESTAGLSKEPVSS